MESHGILTGHKCTNPVLCCCHSNNLGSSLSVKNRISPLLGQKVLTGFVRVLENLESPGILLWHFPGLESPGKKPLVLESSGNLLNSTKNMKCMEGSKEN